jgi:hypothetical protein
LLRQQQPPSQTAAAGFNPDGGFSFFRAKERKNPQKKERKPWASDTANEETPHTGWKIQHIFQESLSCARRFNSPNRTKPKPQIAAGRPCTGYAAATKKSAAVKAKDPSSQPRFRKALRWR